MQFLFVFCMLLIYFFADYLNNSATGDGSLTLGPIDPKSQVNRTQDVTVSATIWDGLRPLQETVTPSPVETADEAQLEYPEGILDDAVNYTNESERSFDLKDEHSVITELKTDVPPVDKFVRAGKREKSQYLFLYCVKRLQKRRFEKNRFLLKRVA